MSLPLVSGIAMLVATIAALADLRNRRIPNWLTVSSLTLGVFVNVWQTGFGGAVTGLSGAALGLAILLPLYFLRAMGAGDVKLLAALGAIVGPLELVSIAVYSALVGGVVAAVMLAARGRLSLALDEMFVQHALPSRSGMTAPYAVAIASGVYLAVLAPHLVI